MRRRIIQFLLSISFLFVLCSCTKENDEAIFVNFINATGGRIEKAKVGNVVIGNIELNGKTGLIRFSEFGTDTGMPDVSFTGMLNGQTIESTSRFFWCATEKSALKPGQYIVHVSLQQYNNQSYFNLTFE
jgi:hypothetical protein